MAYAALLSLAQILHQTLNRDYQYLILDEKQQIESLVEIITAIQKDFSSQKITQYEESEIRDAAYIVEDIIESHIIKRFRTESAGNENGSTEKKLVRFNALENWIVRSGLEFVGVGGIEKRIMEIEDDSGVQDLQARTELPSRSGKSTMVGLAEELTEILNWLVGNSSGRDTLSIVGMAGIGKTTFARKVYDRQGIQDIFHVRAWVTVSRNHNEHKILLDLLDSMGILSGEMHKLETSALKDILYKNLKGRRYLIVVDDIWDTKVWDYVNPLFPVDKEESRIILTTRMEEVAIRVKSSRSATYRMRFLNDDESWKLFCEKVFGGDCCPSELNQTGTEIAKKCGGLPLAIVLIGGLLSKSTPTQSHWAYVAKNLSSNITSRDDPLSNILHLSYNNLPHHLRVCFLYMGVFPEDSEILASKLFELWIAKGFIEPVMSKSLEDVAELYLLNLVERSLILLSKWSSEGKIKTCKIHDLLHEFCVREAKKGSFFHVTDRSLRDLPTEINTSHITDTNFQSLPANFIS